jgi:hypothetical protein
LSPFPKLAETGTIPWLTLSQRATKTWMTGNLLVAAGDSVDAELAAGGAGVVPGTDDEQAARTMAMHEIKPRQTVLR